MPSLFGCAVFFIFTILFALPVGAVTISQLNLEIVARPGETIEQLVQLYDESFSGVTVYPIIYNFTESPDSEGSALILTDPADLKPDRAWVTWNADEVAAANSDENADADTVEGEDADSDAGEDADQEAEPEYSQEDVPIKLPAEGTLADFPYRIEIPQNAEPGTHLISLVFQLKPAEQTATEGAAVYIGSNVATNIFVKVLGATIDDVELDFKSGVFTNKEADISPAKRKESFEEKTFFLKPPVDFLLTVDNKGNTHQKPDGNVKIVNDLFGGASSEKLLVNPENKIILPQTDRTFDVPSFGQGFMFGKYRAKITMLYGDPLRPVEKEIAFWIVPLVEILIALGILLLIIIIIIAIRKFRKKGRARQELEREEKLRQQIIDELKGKKQPPAGKEQIKDEFSQGQEDKKKSGKKQKKVKKGKSN